MTNFRPHSFSFRHSLDIQRQTDVCNNGLVCINQNRVELSFVDFRKIQSQLGHAQKDVFDGFEIDGLFPRTP